MRYFLISVVFDKAAGSDLDFPDGYVDLGKEEQPANLELPFPLLNQEKYSYELAQQVPNVHEMSFLLVEGMTDSAVSS